MQVESKTGRPPENRTVKTTPITLDRVLSEAESLSADDQALLEELLRGRRIESWRRGTAAAGRKAAKAFQAGKLKAQSVESVINQLNDVK